MPSPRIIRHRGSIAWLLAAGMLALAACGKLSPNNAGNNEAAGEDDARSSLAANTADAAPAGLVLGKGDKILTITSDDPKVAVTGVFLDGKPLKTSGLGRPSVRAQLVADPEEGYGTPCDTEGMELRLANGVIFRPQVNFCNSHYLVKAAAQVSRPGATLPPQPEGFVWQLSDRPGEKLLAFGPPESDATVFMASCRQGAMRAHLIVFEDAGVDPRIDFYAPDRILRYDLKRSGDGSTEEAPSNQLELSIADPLWTILRAGKPLGWRLNQGEMRGLYTASGATQIAAFIQWCQGE